MDTVAAIGFAVVGMAAADTVYMAAEPMVGFEVLVVAVGHSIVEIVRNL